MIEWTLVFIAAVLHMIAAPFLLVGGFIVHIADSISPFWDDYQ